VVLAEDAGEHIGPVAAVDTHLAMAVFRKLENFVWHRVIRWLTKLHPCAGAGDCQVSPMLGMLGVVSWELGVEREFEELRRSEERLRVLFDSFDEGYCLCEMVCDAWGEPVDYRFLQVNPVFEEMTGLVDPVGRTALELVPDLEPVWVQTYAKVGLGREVVRFEQGSAAMGRWFDVFSVPVQPHGHFAVVFKDISARRRDEEALRASETRLRDLADHLPLLVWVHDADGQQEWVNETFCAFFGVGREEMLADHWQDLTYPEEGSAYVTEFVRAVAERRMFHAEVQVRRADGQWRWLESWGEPRYTGDGQYVGHLGTSADITERKQSELTLRENHRFITEMTSVVPGVMYVFDLASGSTIYANRSTLEALGYSPEEIEALGSDFLPQVIHPDDVALMKAHQEALRQLDDGSSLTVEYRFRHRDGQWRWFLSRDVVLRRTPGGVSEHILGIATDITDQRVAAEAIRSAAAADAYRARLLDALRQVDDPVAVQVRAVGLLGEHLDTARAQYAEVDPTGEFGVVRADDHPRLDSAVGTYRLDDYGAAGPMTLFRAGESVVVHDVTGDARLSDAEREATLSLGIGSYVLAPVLRQGRVVAAIAVHETVPRPWLPEEVTLIGDTADRTWGAVEKARAERALRVQHSRAELLAAVLSTLQTQSSAEAQLQAFTDVLVPRIADFATIEVPSRAASSLSRVVAGQSHLLAVTPTGQSGYAVDATVTALLNDVSPRSRMTVPLTIGGGVRAALMVGLADPARPHYSPDDLAFLETLAERAGIVLASTHLRRQEHEIAIRLQRALLPDSLVTHPSVSVQARYEAGSDVLEVGGDWYDTFSWPSGQIGLMVGDVVGHTMDSAAAMGRLRAATAALAAHVPPSPAALLDALEEFARGRDGTDFVTATCVVLDPQNGHLTYSSAGHPPIIMATPDGSTRRLFDAQAKPMCVPRLLRAAPVRPEAEITLEPGALVVLYSDGLIERRTHTLEEGIARLEKTVAALATEPLTALADRIIEHMTNDSPTSDDIVVAIMSFQPPEPSE